MDRTPALSLPYILPSQAQKHVTHNEALQALDALVQARVASMGATMPPLSPLEGEAHVAGSGAAGAWTGHDQSIAAFQNGSWQFYPAFAGLTAWLVPEARQIAFDGTNWILASANENPFPDGALSLPLVGVNTDADAVNRLAVKSAAALFSHDDAGADMRLTLNKAAPAATASMLFQTGWSGRAEFGLTGADDFRIKVSGDGSAWLDALAIDRQTGAVSFPQTPQKPVAMTIAQADKLLPGFAMRGTASNNSVDNAEGAGLFLTNNGLNNRQFALLSTDTKVGLRIIAGTVPVIDGYVNGARADLNLGSNTNGAHVGYALATSQFSVSNWTGSVDKTVLEAVGATGQTSDLLAIGTTPSARGDALRVTPAKETVLGGPARLKSYTLATLPSPAAAGAMIFVSNESGGAVPAFGDGANWRRVTDRAVVS